MVSTEATTQNRVVAVIGAGPAGLFAARQIAAAGNQVVLFNRDIKPGGLAEYGIFPTKYKMKNGLRKQFRQILDMPQITYYGNVTIGEQGDLTLAEIEELGFAAIMVTVGAQGTKWLKLPGEDEYRCTYHAKDLVYHYNNLPPFSEHDICIGDHVALIGAGNVMLDVSNWLINIRKVKEVIAVARRGPAEVKFDKKEMENVIANLDIKCLDEDLAKAKPVMEAVGEDLAQARDNILAALPKAPPKTSETIFRFEFFAAPKRIVGDGFGSVIGLEVEDTTLVGSDNNVQAKSLGTTRLLKVENVIFCVGDKVEEHFGLPVQSNEYVKNPQPRFPVDGLSYEAYDPQISRPLEGIFVSGWSREASHGIVGVARKDGENGAEALLQYLQTKTDNDSAETVYQRLVDKLQKLNKPVIDKTQVHILEGREQDEAARQGLEDYKYKSNAEMLQAIGISIPARQTV